MDYMQILSSSALGDDDDEDAGTTSNSMGTFSTSTYHPYDSEEDETSVEGSKVDTNLTSLVELLADGEDTEHKGLNYTKQEAVRLISLRRHVEKMRNGFKIKEQEIQKIREKLNRCRGTICNLTSEENSLRENLEQERNNQNIASVGLLEAKLVKNQTEMSTEQNLEQTLVESLKQAELALVDAQRKQREFDEVSHQLAIDEFLWKKEKDEKANERHQKETQLLLNAKRLKKAQERELLATQQKLDVRSKEIAENARKAHQDGIRFLRESMDKRRAEEVKEEQKHRVYMENRMNALLELKNDIEASQSSIKALQMLAKHKESEEQDKLRSEMDRVLNEGGNPVEAALWKVKLQRIEKDKESLEKQQKERQIQIVAKLLDEEKVAQREEQRKSKPHWTARSGTHHPPAKPGLQKNKKSTQKMLAMQTKELATDDKPPISDEAAPVDTEPEPATEQSEGDGNLAEPEFKGLWETKQTPKAESEKAETKHSKMEDEILQTTLGKLKQNIVKKQIAAGREFKGVPFRSKPEEIIFKDLDIGCIYQKKIQLTNVSYTVNYCKLIGISENLQDFITIDFDPPGAMSAGLTCHMTVIFQPKLNEDLEGAIEFLAQTGPFYIPVKCYTKKCLISVDKETVSFGSVCVGEVCKRTVTITNSGALPTTYHLLPAPLSPLRSQVSPILPVDTVIEEEPHSQPQDPNSGRVFGALGGKDSQLSASHVIARSKLHFDGDARPLSKSTSRIADMTNDTAALSKENEDTHLIPEDLVATVQSEVSMIHSESKLDEAPITVGEFNFGEITGFSTASVELLFSPNEVGEYSDHFQIVFSHTSVAPVNIFVQGKSHDLPIYVDREVMELHTCMLDRLYQDSVILHNRATTALRVTFNVPKPLQLHMEVLPHHGVVQGQSSFSAQLKFLPRASIFTDCKQYIDGNNMLTAPLDIQIADQVRLVPFRVMALVTVSDFEFSVESIDFGTCTIHESVIVTIQLSNKSVLPQKFGFIDLPQVVDIQPNDGFGTLLPLETIDIDVIFSAVKPKEYSFELKCKSGIDRTFTLPCKGQGILPTIQLLDNIIHFAATPVNAISSTSLIIQNVKFSRLSSARIRQAVPPPGKRAFEFIVPDDCPVSLSPTVGTLDPGQKQLIQVEASPKLDPALIMDEAKRLMALEAEKNLHNSQSTLTDNSSIHQQETTAPKKSSRMRKRSVSSSSTQHQPHKPLTETPVKRLNVDELKEGSELWWEARRSLLSDYKEQCFQYTITCFVSSPSAHLSGNEPVTHSQEETLYLEVTLPVIRPSLMVISDHGRDTIDFGDIVNGESVAKTVILKNTGSEELHITSSILDPHGPFYVSNAFRELSPNATHNMLVTFSSSNRTEVFYEALTLFYGNGGSLRLGLKGQSFEPDVELSVKDESIDMGDIIVNDIINHSFQLTNISPLAVKYLIRLDSNRVGPANLDGHVNFDCVPAEGIIASGNSSKINVNFNPDHASSLFADVARVYISNKERFVIRFTGRAWHSPLFIRGGDDITTKIESLAAVPLRTEETPEPLKTFIVTFTHFKSQPEKSELTRTLEICSIKSGLLKKCNGDFAFEPLPSNLAKVFTIDPTKSSVEAGGKKAVTVSFQPSANTSKTSRTIETSIKVTLKSEHVEQFMIILQGRMYD